VALRKALVEAAGRLFRERGIDGVGVAEISRTAGLTHGALYARFQSKEALAAEALSDGFARSFAHMQAVAGAEGPSLEDYLDFLLSDWQRDHPGESCPLTASASEIGRQDEAVSSRFVESFEAMVGVIVAVLDDALSLTERRERSLAIIAAEIGAIAVARAVRGPSCPTMCSAQRGGSSAGSADRRSAPAMIADTPHISSMIYQEWSLTLAHIARARARRHRRDRRRSRSRGMCGSDRRMKCRPPQLAGRSCASRRPGTLGRR
jgi:TetR/AcrR family transcriptional repressor of nem operon